VPRVLSHDEIQAFRGELCAVATRRFAEAGYVGVTLRGLAAELGVSPMTPYRYFRNKDSIFQAVRTEAFRRFGLGIEEAARGLPCPVERIRAAGRAYLRFARGEPHAYRIMFQLEPPAPDADHDPLQHQELRRGWQVLHDAMAEAVARGILRGDPTVLAHLWWIPLHGLVTLHLARRLDLGAGIDELVEPMLDGFFQGHAARPFRPVGGTSP
jgi:AcrR family transcriptional regulator